MGTISIHEMKIAILRELASRGTPAYIYDVLWSNCPGERGPLETSLDTRFQADQRNLAVQAFDQLRKSGLVRTAYTNSNPNPESWVEITDAGRLALKTGILDELDAALQPINPHLLEIRRGAWSGLASGQPDSLRQAAHSARELIDQVLKEGAPDSEVKATHGFKPNRTSQNGITRRMRLKLVMTKYRGAASDTDVTVAEAACDLALAVDNRLTAFAHARTTPSFEDVKKALTVAEIALREILL
jgi:hypothetical protein